MSLYRSYAFKTISEDRQMVPNKFYYGRRTKRYKFSAVFYSVQYLKTIPVYRINEGEKVIPLEFYEIYHHSVTRRIEEHCTLDVNPRNNVFQRECVPIPRAPHLFRYEIQNH